MNVNFEQIDAVNGMLTVELKRDDFAADVQKEVAQMGVRHPDNSRAYFETIY